MPYKKKKKKIFKAAVTIVPSEFRITAYLFRRKLERCYTLNQRNNVDDMFSRFDIMLDSDSQLDRQTDSSILATPQLVINSIARKERDVD